MLNAKRIGLKQRSTSLWLVGLLNFMHTDVPSALPVPLLATGGAKDSSVDDFLLLRVDALWNTLDGFKYGRHLGQTHDQITTNSSK